MRISDWSSDVCSSDLTGGCWTPMSGWRTATGPMRSAPASDPCRAIPVQPCVPLFGWKPGRPPIVPGSFRSEEHTSELQSLMRISYAVFCLNKTTSKLQKNHTIQYHIQCKQLILMKH